MNRRAFLSGLIAAPAVVAVANIMPVRSISRLLLPSEIFLTPSRLAIGVPISFATAGALPFGIAEGVTYYVISDGLTGLSLRGAA